MKPLLLIVLFVVGVGVSEARAERASVAAGKAVVTAGKAVASATKAAVSVCPGRSAWRGLRWLARHV